LKTKVDSYLQHGSKTIWVFYPESRSVMVHSGDSAREVKADQKIEDPLLPGFSVPFSSFFELT
jgi:Uma2 family endonuclease